MVMRLLDKREVDTAKATDKKREVDEGKKLAKTIDNLREVKAQEEASLTKFRRETVKTIHEEISRKTEERDALKRENDILKEERAILQEPLDKAWEDYHNAKAQLDEREEGLSELKTTLAGEKRKLDIQGKESVSASTRAASWEGIARRLLSEAEAAGVEANRILEKAQRTKTLSDEMADKVRKELMHRDMMASSRERSVTMREADVESEKIELAKEWILLKDRQTMHERNLKRTKK